MQTLLMAPLITYLVGAALTLVLPRGRLVVAVGLSALVSALAGLILANVLRFGPVAVTMGNWIPPFGITFAADAVSAGFLLVAALVATALLLALTLERPAQHPALAPLILMVMAGVSGAFFTADLFNLYVWFEVILIASFALFALGGAARDLDATLKYGVLNLMGTTIFLIALGLTYGSFGTLNMADLARAVPKAPLTLQLGVAALMILGFGTKAALFPVQAWLPASYHVPHPALSALFGALLTKVGVYALFRVMSLVFPGLLSPFAPLLTASVVLTLIVAPLGALSEPNLRRATGFLVIGGIGAAVSGLVIATPAGFTGGLLYGLQAMAVLASLYLLIGRVEARDDSPILRALVLLLLLSLAGVPPLPGFWPKLILIEAGLRVGGYGSVVAVALFINAALTLIAVARLYTANAWASPPTEQPRLGLVIPALAGALALSLGLIPAPLIALAEAGGRALSDPSAYSAAIGLFEAAP